MRPTRIFAAIAALALLGGCDRDKGDGAPMGDRNRPVTPFQQGNSQADLDTTKNIRQALIADDTLSQSAKNATVVTSNGAVVLRGTVKNAAEKTAVEEIARRHAAGNRVENQLDLATPETHAR